MKSIVCEMCGSNDLVKQEGLFVCQNCGTKYSVEEAKKMMVEIDTSKVDENLYKLARRAVDSSDYDKVKEYYDKLLINNPDDWEAMFFSIIGKAYLVEKGKETSEISFIKKNIPQIIDLAMTSTKSEKNRRIRLKKIMTHTADALRHLSLGCFELITTFPKMYSNLMRDNLDFEGSIVRKIKEFGIKGELGEPDEWKDIYITSLRRWGDDVLIEHHLYKKHELNSIINELEEVDPTYKRPKLKSEGCYIATCIYGSYDCPEVWTLRRFRDCYLRKRFFGRLFIKVYYYFSPKLVSTFGNNALFKQASKKVLNKLVNLLNKYNYSNDPYEDFNAD